MENEMTPTNEAGHGLPELPEWSKRDDLGGLVPSQIRSELRAYARDALALSRGVPETGSWIAADDVYRHARTIDVALNGEDGAASRPALCDVVAQIASLARQHGPLAAALAAPAAAGAQGEDGKSARESFNAGWMDGHDKGWSSGYQRGLYDAAGMPFDFDWNGAKAKAYTAYNNTTMPQQSVATPQPAAADGGVRERARAVLADAQQRADGHGVNARLILDEGMSLRCNVACDVALRAIEAALSSHRQAGDVAASVCLVTERRLPHFASVEVQLYDGYEPKIGDKLYTTPEPNADAVRELARHILNWQPLTSINKADRLYQILMDAGLPFESVTDELESLLALVEKGAGNG